MGTRQGDRALFSLVVSFVNPPLQNLSPKLTIMMYANDISVLMQGTVDSDLLASVLGVVAQFGYFYGLKMHWPKALAIVRDEE